MVGLTTQLLIPSNILWLPLCRIYKFGLNTLPSKTVAIAYTCGLSGATMSAIPYTLYKEILKDIAPAEIEDNELLLSLLIEILYHQLGLLEMLKSCVGR